jgi:phosphatidate cytidylyltransferase
MDFPERPTPTRPGSSGNARRPRRPRLRRAEGDSAGEASQQDHGAPGGAPSEPAPRKRKRTSETVARLLWAIPLIVLAVTVVAVGGEIFAAAMIAFALIGIAEFFQMTKRARPFTLVAFAAAAGMIVAAHFGDSFQMVLAGVAFFPVMLVFVIARGDLRNVTYSMSVTVFAIVWIGLPFAHAVLLRDLPDHGAALLVDVLVATFFTDTFAYLGGRMFGRRPLAPVISPNKTIEGLLIGVVAGTAGFWLAGLYQDWLSGTDALIMGLCIALLAPLGDLFESAIKRDLDVKDSGRVFGPHGGLLDRLDAVLFTVVAGYYLSLAFVY